MWRGSPCVIAAVIRTHWNGWCTARRFQRSYIGGCRLDERCTGDDSTEHYGACATVWDFANRKLRLQSSDTKLQDFLLVSRGMDQSCKVRTALLVYSVYATVNTLRADGKRAGPGGAVNLLWERLRKTCMLHPGCAKLIGGLWTQTAGRSFDSGSSRK